MPLSALRLLVSHGHVAHMILLSYDSGLAFLGIPCISHNKSLVQLFICFCHHFAANISFSLSR